MKSSSPTPFAFDTVFTAGGDIEDPRAGTKPRHSDDALAPARDAAPAPRFSETPELTKISPIQTISALCRLASTTPRFATFSRRASGRRPTTSTAA